MTTTITSKPHRDIPADLFLDITTSGIDSMDWVDGELVIVFTDDLTAGQIIDVRLRMGTVDDTEGVLLGELVQARADNTAYLNLGFIGPDEVQLQMSTVCAQINKLCDLLLGERNLADLEPPTP